MCGVRFLLLLSFAISIGSTASHVIKRNTKEALSQSDQISAAVQEFVGNVRGNVFQLKDDIEKFIGKDVESDNEEKKAAAQIVRSVYKNIEKNFETFSVKAEEQFTSKNIPAGNSGKCQMEVAARAKAYQDANEAEMNALLAAPVTSFADIDKLMDKQEEIMNKMEEFEQQTKECDAVSGGTEGQSSGGPDPEFIAVMENLTKFDLPESIRQFYEDDLIPIIKRYTESFGAVFTEFQKKLQELHGV